jgi:hypothetical protein
MKKDKIWMIWREHGWPYERALSSPTSNWDAVKRSLAWASILAFGGYELIFDSWRIGIIAILLSLVLRYSFRLAEPVYVGAMNLYALQRLHKVWIKTCAECHEPFAFPNHLDAKTISLCDPCNESRRFQEAALVEPVAVPEWLDKFSKQGPIQQDKNTN